MTCIVGLVHKKKVWIGGDSAGVGGLDITVRKDPKVFLVGDQFIMGFTSSFRMGQLLMHGFDPPKQTTSQTDYAYMVTTFVDAVRARFKAGGYAEVHNSAERGGVFLVGFKGVLYKLFGDYQVGISETDYESCGCGEDYAKGAMFNTTKMEPKKRIENALKTAAYFSAGVTGPFLVLNA